MQAKAFNPQVFLEFLCYCLFGGLMLHLVNSRKYLSYVTPRMEPYLYFTAIVMLIWACVGLFRLFRPQHIVRSTHCFVLAVPILLLLLPHSPLSSSELSGSYTGGNTFSNRAGQSSKVLPQNQAPSGNLSLGATAVIPAEDPAGSSPDAPSSIGGIDMPSEDTGSAGAAIPDTQAGVPDEVYSADLPGLDAENRKITVSNDDFGVWLSEIYINMERYEGYTVVMTGFVFKDPNILNDDEFVPARLTMSCCVADLAPAGLLCKYDKASELKKDSWITVEGTLFIGQYEFDGQKYDDPQINVTKITPAEAVEGYVYPY
ncbi:hypothetical protein OXPF_25690 [Oxobacter pfennigii]|uniref:Two-component membrane permease complex subunit n=1 Tax=Oxobacter pfennigii TaxID=36849 RepID=A0A0N8NT52_9CLOT|nr:TIGR03943 family protein [Oxobacter pfennigii]KPU43864.1 hypothetical protein OXPF_25690 [Oxobacter pfennigii]